jgi:hypothetical protein
MDLTGCDVEREWARLAGGTFCPSRLSLFPQRIEKIVVAVELGVNFYVTEEAKLDWTILAQRFGHTVTDRRQ